MDFLLIGVVIAGLLVAWFLGKKKEVYSVLLLLVKKAEEKFNQGENKEKFEYVWTKIEPSIPLILRMFITKKTVNWLIDKALLEAKKELSKLSGIALASAAVEKLSNEIILAQVNGDSNLCDNKTVLEAKERVKIDLGISNDNGTLYGALNGSMKVFDGVTLKGSADTKGNAGLKVEMGL
jgi:hypothetical protein